MSKVYAVSDPAKAVRHNYHAATWVEHPAGLVYLDLGIVADVRALWDAGIGTWVSCEGDREMWRYVSLTTQDPALVARAQSILGWVVRTTADGDDCTLLRDR